MLKLYFVLDWSDVVIVELREKVCEQGKAVNAIRC